MKSASPARARRSGRLPCGDSSVTATEEAGNTAVAAAQAVAATEAPAASVATERPNTTWQSKLAWQDGIIGRGDNDDENAWLITYLDMITLLLTVFVVMLAYSTFEPDRFSTMESGLRQQQPQEQTQDQNAQNASAADSADPVARLASRLAAQLTEAGMSDAVKIGVEDRRLTLQMQENILFPSGLAELNALGKTLLDRLTPSLTGPGQMISVEGHTDNLPIKTGMFPSNWELSAARASGVTRYLSEHGIPANRLRAIGYGDTRPVAENAEETGRAANRRVVMVIDLAVVPGTK